MQCNMKTLILTKGLTVSDVALIKEGMAKVKTLLPQFEFTYQETAAQFSSIPFKNDVAEGYYLNNGQLLNEVVGDFHIACLFFDATQFNPQPTNPTTSLIKKGNTIPMSIHKQWYSGYVDVLVQFFLHEVCHAEFYRAGQKDITHDFYGSQFSQMPGGQTLFYVSLLKKLLDKPMPTPINQTKYKYFSPAEVAKFKLTPEMFTKLDILREKCGFPFVIASGRRSVAQNASLSDSVSDSAHLSGLAADIVISDSIKRFKIVQVALENGINRIGIGKNFVHLDISTTLPNKVLWHYY